MRGTPVLFTDLSKGLNSKDAPYRVAEGEARDLLNVVSTSRGAIRKRDGSIQHAAVDANSLFAGLSPSVLIAALGTKLQKIDGAGVATDIKTGLTDSLPWEWVAAPVSGGQGPYYGMNGTDTPQQFDGTSGATANWTATVGSVPNGKYVIAAGNRVWVTGLSSDPSAVYWSDIGDPRNWPAENIVRLDPNDGGEITGIGTTGPFVLVFKERKTWVIRDLDRGANNLVSGAIGCVSHRSIADTQRGTYFLAQSGVFRTDGHSVDKVSRQVDPTFDQMAASQRRKTAGMYFDDHYYLSFVRSSSDPDRTLDFDLNLQSWWLHSIAARQWVVWEPSSGLELLGAVPTRVSRVFVPATATDAAVAYAGYWASTFHVFGAPALRKRLRGVSFDGSGKIEFEVARDFSPSTSREATADFTGSDGLFGVDDGSVFGIDDGSIYGGLSTVQDARAMSLGVARAFSVKFGNLTADPFEIDSYTMFLNPLRKD